MPRSRTSLILPAALLAAVVAAVVILTSRGSDQEEVTITRTGGPVALASLNRSDELGADTVRAYVRAAMDCSTRGADVRRRLSGPDNEPVEALVDATCLAGRRVWPAEVTAKATTGNLDARQRARWRIESGQGLPAGLVVYVEQVDGGWTIAGRCLRACDTDATGAS